ncbi:galactose mutarotase [Alphaproteobacteria bacterium]|nr:galactose mutarotase [Alphaproteobacteria bacterium]
MLYKKKIYQLNNEDVYSITIKNNNNYAITFHNYGGYIHSIKIPLKNNNKKYEDVVLGYGSIKECIKATGYFNSIIGRVGNRISKSQFTLNKNTYKLFNNVGENHLHGGKEGFNKKVWKIKKINETNNEISCELEYYSKSLEEGYPGNLYCTANYILNNKNEFIIKYSAKTDADTLVNMTNHNYWNFHGHGNYYQNITDHSITLYSDTVCENNQFSIPTGKLINVKNTNFDFSKEKNITQEFLDSGGIDNNYDVGDEFKLKKIAKVYSQITRMGVEYYSDQPGVQFYTGNMMANKYEGKENRKYGLQYGLCLEPQFFPDAINQENFCSPILRANSKYTSTILMKLFNNF